MRTIHKVTLQIKDTQTIFLPWNFEPLSIQVQDGEIVMWYLCDTTYQELPVVIYCYGTGHNIYNQNNTDNYLGTVQLNGLVWHFFN
jgi:hypothetical protein